jgi:hypothetical protein
MSLFVFVAVINFYFLNLKVKRIKISKSAKKVAVVN